MRPGGDSELGDGEEESFSEAMGQGYKLSRGARNRSRKLQRLFSKTVQACKVRRAKGVGPRGVARVCGSQGGQSEVYNIRKPYRCRSGGFPKRNVSEGGGSESAVGIDGSAGSCRAVSIRWSPIHADSRQRTDALAHRGRRGRGPRRGLTEYVDLLRASSPKTMALWLSALATQTNIRSRQKQTEQHNPLLPFPFAGAVEGGFLRPMWAGPSHADFCAHDQGCVERPGNHSRSSSSSSSSSRFKGIKPLPSCLALRRARQQPLRADLTGLLGQLSQWRCVMDGFSTLSSAAARPAALGDICASIMLYWPSLT
jgi:hypothetical protein